MSPPVITNSNATSNRNLPESDRRSKLRGGQLGKRQLGSFGSPWPADSEFATFLIASSLEYSRRGPLLGGVIFLSTRLLRERLLAHLFHLDGCVSLVRLAQRISAGGLFGFRRVPATCPQFVAVARMRLVKSLRSINCRVVLPNRTPDKHDRSSRFLQAAAISPAHVCREQIFARGLPQ